MGTKSKKSKKSKTDNVQPKEKAEPQLEEETEATTAAAAAPPKSEKSKKNKKRRKSKDESKKVETKDTQENKETIKTKKASVKESSNDGGDSDESGGSEEDMKLTLEALDAISDEDSNEGEGNGGGNDDEDESGDEEEDEGEAEVWDAEALALRNAIQSGQFDALLKNIKRDKKGGKEKGKKEEEGVEEDGVEEEMEMDDSEEEMEEKDGEDDTKEDDEEDEEEEEDEDDEEENEEDEARLRQKTNAIALTTALQQTDRRLPWPETFAIVPPTPLPFGPVEPPSAAAGKKRKRNDEADDGEEDDEPEYVDIHDDLKREVAFYDCALEAVTLARAKCEEFGIPFTRPEDFFAEMVKSDDHMAKIKDRLIFETKKIEAVERRKSNKEQTLMAKERHAHRLAEKAKAKKAHMSAVEDWKKNAANNRGGRYLDTEEEEDRLRGLGGVNKKRMAANKKYGFGGKRGRFKQNDKKTLDDMSGFNPRGGFKGGQKTTVGKKKGGGAGKKRPGKRARDAAKRS